MELEMTGWVLAFCAALAIIPTTNRDRVLNARTLRGDEPTIARVKIEPEDLATARKALAGSERITVLPFVAPAQDAGLTAIARGVTVALTSDLHYVPGLIVLDRAEMGANSAAPADPAKPAELAAMAQALGARYAVVGSVARQGSELAVNAVLVDAASREVVARAAETGPEASVMALADRALLALLPKDHAPDDRRAKEIAKVPTANQRARALYDQAAAITEQMAGVTDGDDRELASKALGLVESALKLDPKYLQAALLHAGCLARLGRTPDLEKSLTRAHNVRVPPERFDELTLLELEGDYYLFVKGDPRAAIGQYTKMLEIDPNHLRALWMLTALHAGDFAQAKRLGVDLTKARAFAARLVVAHPASAAAKFLNENKP
jgi:TolB-like protein